MGLSAEMLSKLGPAFGAPIAANTQNELAIRGDIPEFAINSTADKVFTKAEEDILRLLSDGHTQETVSSTLGITPSQISQYIAKESFRAELSSRKSKKLEKYKKLDDGYDRMEQSVADKLEASISMVSKPGDLLAIATRLNAMKRRMGDGGINGSAVPVQQIVQVVLPTVLIHKFTKTAAGHIVAIDDKSLVTIGSGTLASISNEQLVIENGA